MERPETAARIIAARKQKSLSQEELAGRAGVTLRTIQRIESGSVNPHPQTLSMIAAGLNLPVEDFTSGDINTNQDSDTKKWLILMHLTPIIGSVFPGGSLIVPVVAWFFKRGDNAEFDRHGRMIINFQISMAILLLISFILTFIVFTPAGTILMLSGVTYNVIMVLINTWRVAKELSPAYFLSVPFIGRKAARISSVIGLLIFCAALHLQAQQIKRIDGTEISSDSLNSKIISLMEKGKVSGMQVAVYNKNKAIYKKSFGIANTEHAPLHPAMNVYGASLSKTVFAVLVMKLVEEGFLDLDKPLQSYLPKPIYEYPQRKKWQDDYQDLRNDTNYTKITVRMCLTHTSGFPNWRWDNPDQKLKTAFEPGSRYGYSGEGMVYLQTVIEHITGKSLEQLMDEKIFKPLGMVNSAYTFLPRFESDYALGFNSEGKAYPKDKDNEARAPSTLETTLDDFVIFMEDMLQGKILKKKSWNEMLRPQIRLRSMAQFGPLSLKETSANDGISLSYGLGMGLLKSPYGWAAFKEGHGDGFQHYFIIFPEKGIGVLIMTNSDNSESVYKELLEFAIADIYTPWKWQNYVPYDHKD